MRRKIFTFSMIIALVFVGITWCAEKDDVKNAEGKGSMTILIPALSGLIGVSLGAWLTAWLTARREQVQRRHTFIEQQLKEFYSPLLGIRNEIKMLTELRVKVHDAADTAWRDLCEKYKTPEHGQKLQKERWYEFERIIEYDNSQAENELFPAYNKMADLFRDHIWLAEPETRSYYDQLLCYIETWYRWNQKALPHEVLQCLGGNSDKTLQPFYAHIQEKHDELRLKLKTGTA